MSTSEIHHHSGFGPKTYLLAVIAYVVLTFAFAATWHFVLFADLYKDLAIFTRAEPIVPLGLSSMLLQGLIMAYAYPKLCSRQYPIREGLVFGLLCGLFLSSGTVLGEAGKQNVTSLSTFLILEMAFYVIQFSLSGLAIGLVYGKANR